MKLASAIEDFIQYKRALGNLYITSASILKAFLRKTGNLELDALTSGHCEAFLPVKSGMVTSSWFQKYENLDRFFPLRNRPRIYTTSSPPDFDARSPAVPRPLHLFDRRHPSLAGRA
jgi:hypothetical protein